MVERPGHFQKPEAASAQCLIYLLWGSWPSLFTAGSPLQRLRKQGSVLCSQKLTRRVCCNGAALLHLPTKEHQTGIRMPALFLDQLRSQSGIGQLVRDFS